MYFSKNIIANIDSKKEVYEICTKLNQEILLHARKFYVSQKEEIDKNCHSFAQEIASGAKYLHRGYYCPSRMQELLIDNVKRGKLVKQPTSKTKISHKYYYANGNLQVIDTYLSSADTYAMREYLIYDRNIIYGVTCYPDGRIIQLSAELYSDGKLSVYYVANCYLDDPDGTIYSFLERYFEKYTYQSDTICDGTIFTIFSSDINPNNKEEIERCIGRYDYKLEWNSTTGQWTRKT